MSDLIQHTVQDLRAGRESWRVLLFLSLGALVAGFVTGMVP
jgi:hypothetical protein